MGRNLELLTKPLVDDNPVILQVLGICSALAVTTSMATALTMCIALTVVLILSSGLIALIREHIPGSVRLIIQITIVASLVIVIDQFLQAYFFEMSQKLSIFVSLIVTNCIVLGRIEAFAMRNTVRDSALDALGNGLGYSMILMAVAFVRELLGSGSLFGYTVFVTVDDGGWFQTLSVMQLAPSAFFIIAFIIWGVRSFKPEQIEANEFLLTAHKEEKRS